MGTVWNKGLTKNTNKSVHKISETMKQKRIDNFSEWREKMKKEGKIKSTYPSLKKDGNLAELIGVVLGDGNIYKFARTEGLRIVGNSAYPGFAVRYSKIIESVFGKKPSISKRSDSNAFNITIYERNISERLGIPSGSKKNLEIKVPRWILGKKKYICRYLRGLYESDGSFSVHRPTYTYKFMFSNLNQSLLCVVYRLLKKLEFHPHSTKTNVQISKKNEVYAIKELIQFRHY